MRIYIICPVRNATQIELHKINEYVRSLEKLGHIVHFPPRDTNQDNTGIQICEQNRKAIEDADEIHIFWVGGQSKGSLFDFGMAFMLRKPIVLINKVIQTSTKSFENVLLTLHERNEK